MKKIKWYWWLLGGIVLVVIIALLNRRRVMKNLDSMALGPNFLLSEFVTTSTGIDNIPGDREIENLRALVQNILQPLRTHLGKPISISSGFRSGLVNKAIGGSTTSQHMTGEAADFSVSGMTNQQIIDTIRSLKLPYDQLIDEQLKGKKWVHVSFSRKGGRRQWMTARDGANGATVYNTIEKLA